MKDCFGQHGWKEFHRNRKNILDEYQRLLDLTANRPVQVAHGQGVEAYIRTWLSEFLPKKYGVTSGYIIPNLYDDTGVIYHFDIIIYNRLDAPILWTEGNQDNSEQGKFRAIPAKHVVAVYEIKSRFNKDNVVDALKKLDQLTKFKDQFLSHYSSGIIFIELKENDNNSKVILKALHRGTGIFGFVGGMVMKYENDDSATGYIISYPSGSNSFNGVERLSPLAKKIDDLNIYQTEDGNVTLAEQGGGAILVATSSNTYSVSKMYGVGYELDGKYLSLDWSRSNFSRFCVDLLSRLEGLSLNDERRQSFGMVFDSLRQEIARTQPVERFPNYPFLVLRLDNGGPNGERHLLNFAEECITLTLWMEVTNEGNAEATISDDGFQSSAVLPQGKKAIKTVMANIDFKKDDTSVLGLLNGDGFVFPYRLVYKAGTDGKEFFAVEENVRVRISEVSLESL